MVMVAEAGPATCVHHWMLSSPTYKNHERITHERCKLCNGERDLIEAVNYSDVQQKNAYSKRYTDIVWVHPGPEPEPVKEPERRVEEMAGKGGNNRGKKAYYDEHRKEIEAAIAKHGKSLRAAAEECGIPPSTLLGLKKRWSKPPKRKPTPQAEDILNSVNAGKVVKSTPQSAVPDFKALSKDEKIAIAIESRERGANVVANERNIPVSFIGSWIGTYLRSDKVVKHKGAAASFEQVIDEALKLETIGEVRAFFAGYKIAASVAK